MVNGLADVCCRQNPIAIINKDNNIRLKEPILIAGIIMIDPIIETNKP